MAVDWSLGVPRVDVGAQFLAGYDHGRQLQQQQAQQNALRAYAANPTDQGAQNALLVANPQLATALEDQRFQREQAQRQQVQAQLEQHRERIIMGGRIFQSIGVNDETSYQRALSMAHQAGVDLTDVPPNYDPNYVNGVIALGQQLSARAMGPMVIPQGAVLADPASRQIIARGDPERPRYYSVPPGGTLQLDPSYQGPSVPTQGASPRMPAVGEIQQGYRFRGGDPADPRSWEPVQGGAPQPQAAGTFR